MSRVAKNPIQLPAGVEVKVNEQHVTVKGAKGSLEHTMHHGVQIVHEDGVLTFSSVKGVEKSNAQAGTARAIINNLVNGVTNGFEKKLQLVGVGYRAASKGKTLDLSLGFSHPVAFPVPNGIEIETPSNTEIVIKGIDKQLVGQVAANIREYRRPEPYKGKGIRYSDEVVRRKEAKKK
jgi:large subunit ribosomal protein L6